MLFVRSAVVATRNRIIRQDEGALPRPHLVENTIRRLNGFHHVAIRNDKLAVKLLPEIALAAAAVLLAVIR